MRMQQQPEHARRILWSFSLVAATVLINAGAVCGQQGLPCPFECAGGWPNDSCLASLLNRECGVSIDPVYYGEVFTNARGGISTSGATKYQALLDLPVTIDFEKLNAPLPGTFFLLAQNTHGRGLTLDYVGDTMVFSNIDSGVNIMQVSEYWWEFLLCDGDIAVRLGKQDLNTEFLVMESASDFIQSSFGLSPAAAPPSYPNPSMAAVVLAQLTNSLQLKTGIWDVLAHGGSWGFSGNDVLLVIAELQHNHVLSFGGRELPGTLEAGMIYSPPDGAFGLDLPSATGVYVQIQQLIYRESTSPSGQIQGLGLFASYHPRFGDNNPFKTFLVDAVAGAVYTGLLPGRDADVIGLGFAWAELNQSGPNQETAVELFYKAQITPSVSLQPDLQYIVTPSGILPDALVAGVRFVLTM